MVARNTRAESTAGQARRRQRPAAEPAATNASDRQRARTRRAAPEPEAVEESTGRDVTVYATKEPTPFHKAFAKWIVTEVGYRPSQAESLKAAFLAGVSIATAARPAFNDSQWLEDWREENNVVKRGRPKGSTNKVVEPEPEEDEDLDDDDIDEDDADDDDFDDEDDSDSDDDADDDDFDDGPVPVASKRGRPAAKAAPAKKAAPAQIRRGAAKATPAKATGTRRAKPAADDDFAF